ncbi:ABC transporter permease [Chloroflexi bacterium TSY]|nr:ABC transporter permease [Chloroflexi bacterium TSY]
MTQLAAESTFSSFTQAEIRADSLLRIALRQLMRNRAAVVGMAIIILLIVIAILAPLIAPYDPIKQSRDNLAPPSITHLMGTDLVGRDIFSRILHGARLSLLVGLISVGIGAISGVLLGLLAGYYGSWLDMLEMRLIDILLAFPGLLLALSIITILGPSLVNLMIAVGISSIPEYARLVRGAVLSAKENVYVDAAHVVGCKGTRVMFQHILPNVVASVIVLATLGVGRAILLGAALSFLGLGAQPPTPEWGAMLSSGRDYLRRAWWVTTFPGMAITITVLAVNMLGDGLRDALDPRLRIG